MAHVLSPAPSSGFASRGLRRRRGVDWKIVGLTGLSAVVLVAALGRPADACERGPGALSTPLARVLSSAG